MSALISLLHGPWQWAGGAVPGHICSLNSLSLTLADVAQLVGMSSN